MNNDEVTNVEGEEEVVVVDEEVVLKKKLEGEEADEAEATDAEAAE